MTLEMLCTTLLVRQPKRATQTEPPTPPARQNDPTPRGSGPQNFLNPLAARWAPNSSTSPHGK